MPRVGHPWWKHFYDARFIIMEVDTSMMIFLLMSWNTSTTAQVWLSWFCHKIVMDVHAWQKTWPTVTNTYHHESVFFLVHLLMCWDQGIPILPFEPWFLASPSCLPLQSFSYQSQIYERVIECWGDYHLKHKSKSSSTTHHLLPLGEWCLLDWLGVTWEPPRDCGVEQRSL